MLRRLWGVFLLAALASCAGEMGKPEADTNAVGLVTHGIEIPEGQMAFVVKLRKLNGKLCTGVFIEAPIPLLLTASHCLNKLDDPTGGLKYKNKRSIKAWVAPSATGHFGPRDLAIVAFNRDEVDVPDEVRIAASSATKGEAITIVGYGRNDMSDPDVEETGSGVKRLGRNRVHRIVPKSDKKRAGMIEIHGALEGDLDTMEEVEESEDSGTGKGDSGGPILVKRNGRYFVAGINSGGRKDDDERISYSVNLNDPEIAAFIRGVMREVEKSPPTCARKLARSGSK